MSSVETYYLVDFENVHEDGLSGSEHLGSQDHVHLFSTRNAPKISIEKLTHFNATNLYTHEVPTGNQSLDMHLISYLGYLIGTNGNKVCKYIIVSKDTDYDNVISFWETHNCPGITRQKQIIIQQPQKNSNSATSAGSSSTVDKKAKSKTSSQIKTLINTEIQQALSKAGFKKDVNNKTASIVVKHYGEAQFSNNVHNELRNTYTNYAEVYQVVKPIINRYTPAAASKANSTTELNGKVQKHLSSAGFTAEIINYTASLVSKNYKANNNKQTVYRAIVAKYGQKKGLNIYNHIKKLF